ncbi:intermembrane phospholipid transport protein YdbH family protein [Microbulbifer thermotolerans]|uniref:Uncharacterized protein n=1 Tax=Microbulbifer thermotolerans TaxID=252514 RepID=A0A143HMN0_MICTH|nr:YdbH domain-containing protein [Microbulbifer thermotolerans]AMX02943.1 hypothetical protein A3224_10495 [Microbulbifer thermotolerans]
MQRRRALLLAAILIITATGSWIWLDRERLTVALINPLLQTSRIDSLRGLQPGIDAITVDEVHLSLASGASMRMEDLRLSHPWGLIFTGERNRSRLSIASLQYTPPQPQAEAAPVPTSANDKAVSAEDASLRTLIALVHKTLPEHVQVEEFRWFDDTMHRGQLHIARNDDRQSVKANATFDRQELTLLLRSEGGQLHLSAQLDDKKDGRILSFTGALLADTSDLWLATITLQSDLQKLSQLPLPDKLAQFSPGATGAVSARLQARLPDRVLRLEEYSDISVKLEKSSIQLALPQALLGTEAAFNLTVDDHLEVKLAALRPLEAKSLSGSGNITLTPKDMPTLLQARFASTTSQGQPQITATGNLNLQALTPWLQSSVLQDKLPDLRLTSAAGKLQFQGSATAKSLTALPDGRQSWLDRFDLSLLPDSWLELSVSQPGASPDGWQNGKIAIHLPEVLAVRTDQWPGKMQLNSAEIRLRAQEKDGNISVNAQLQQIECSLLTQTRCSLEIVAESPEPLGLPGALTLENFSMNSELQFHTEDNQQQWLLSQAEVWADDLKGPSLQAERLSLTAPQLQCRVTNGSAHCESMEITAAFSTLDTPGLRSSGALTFSDVQFRQSGRRTELNAGYHANQIRLKTAENYALNIDIQGNLLLEDAMLHGESQLLSGPVKLQAQWQHNLNNAEGTADFTFPKTSFSRTHPLSRAIEGLPVDIVAGTLSASGRYSWPMGTKDHIHLQLEQAAAVFGDSFAAGVAGEISLYRRGNLWLTDQPQAVQVDRVDFGLPIENIHFSISLDEKRDLAFNAVNAQLLGGTLESSRLVWNLDGEEHTGKIQIQGISLSELAREMEAENFAATGTLDLEIPMATSSEGVTVRRGQVKARPPGGRLRYYGAFSPQMLSGNPQLKLLAGALEDYNYRALSGTLDYPSSGDMRMQLKLVGRSQSVAADRDLIINLNLENNIPDMLRSLQASRDLTEALEKTLQ